MNDWSKRLKKCMVPLLALSIIVPSSMIAGTAAASPTTHAFNTATGALNVDYAAYLAKHDVVFNSPVTDTKSALMVGNGRVGGMVWDTANGITMQVSGVDASEEGFASQGLVNLYTNPGLNTGYTNYQQRLSLYDGLLTNKYDSNRTVTIMGSPNSEVMGIHVDDSRTGLSNVTLDLSLWDVSAFGGGDVPDINTWRTVSTFVDPTVVGFSRGQTDANHFGYTMAATVEGASFTTQAVSGSKVRLNITPSSSYTIWISTASRLNAPSFDSVTQAKSLVNSVKAAGYSTTLTNYKNWWHSFWNKSFVQYSNASGDADYLENFYYLSTYMIAAGGFGNYPNHFINGVFSAVNDNDSGKWSNAYWYWNQRDVYHSFLASNHADMVNIFNNLYSRNYNTLKSYTMTRYGIDGIWVPETMGWNASAAGTIGSDYTKNIFSTGAEAALNMYNQYKYTNDATYLSNTAYPFMREAAKFLAAKLTLNTSTGKYYMASSNAHEQYWNVQNAITDLAAVRSLFPVTIQTSTTLGLDSTLRTQWQNILNNLVAYPVDPNDPNKYFPHTPPLSQNRNDENTVAELAWPYSVTGIGAPDYQIEVNSFNSRPYGYGDNVWDPAPIQAARLGLGDGAYQGMRTMVQKYQDYPNGRTTNTNGEFEYIGVNLSAMNESLLQSYNDKIRVFPALPNDTAFVSKFTLLASGGFQVSSEKESNEIKYIGIKSLYGKTATVINPWGTQQIQVKRMSDNAIVLTSSSNEFNFSTAANTVYVVERTAKQLSSYTYQGLTGSVNNGIKSLTYNGVTRNLGNGAPYLGAKPTFYDAANFSGTGVSLAPGNYSISQMTAAGIANDSISSIKVPAGITVTGYADGAFDGASWTFTSDNSNLANTGNDNAISSIRITGSGSATPAPTATPTPTPTPGALTIPGKIEAESYSTMSGIQTENTTDTGAGLDVGFTDTGDWLDYNVNVQSAGTYTVGFRVASINTGSQLQLRNSGGTVLTTVTVPNTAGWQTWTTVNATVTLSAGNQTLRLYVSNGGFNVNWLNFASSGASSVTFYPDSNFGGTGVALPVGSYTIAQMIAAGIANDSISSIKVPAGRTVVAYGDGAFDGPSWTFTADNSNLASTGNDNTISSFVIS